MTTDPITSIVEKNLCTGCGACAIGKDMLIRMVDDPEHGRRPVVSQTPQGLRASQEAQKRCAGVSTDWGALEIADNIDQAWGPVRAVWQGYAQDDEIRHRGSSGGVVTALAFHAMTSGIASGVAHIVARKDDPRLNETVISKDRAGLLRGAGSRYAQASPAEVLDQISEDDEAIVFIGKPCDVASVYKATEHNQELAARIPLTIAIFCAGAPNLAATDSLLDRLSVPKDGKLTDLRYRGNGWPGLMQAWWDSSRGDQHVSEGISYAEGWGAILQASRRWRCRICADHTGAFADISVGDPWHTPPNGNTDAGQSLIIARTARGQRFIEDAINKGHVVAQPAGRDVIARAQPNLLTTNSAVWGRRTAMRMVGLDTPKDKGQKLFSFWMSLPAKQKFQSFLGTWKRVIRERLWRGVRISERLR
ncbi:coenzyme F420 hydrogenase [Phaeobacter gallaeciensis]|uniref:Coenzyme F420 hydrogenase n=2 Tax=Phaeobacter gallaeciensis TaxID=60890 RepID=A0A366X8S3_9RHOB|nr:Coenzyme F420 hydrogenase/dehydrogenase, beta subunit C-terminal domain [Falsiruegeria litorea]MBT8169631.1 Coenzyme F420 hydrogenase/dehydrogenase, beta subunit C-terminal domain [Falsiruegeria litorea]RBW62189.1 coenzyme F420 hydrogenase [Phaeobacter gallaeciensis]